MTGEGDPQPPLLKTWSTADAPADGVIDYWREVRRRAYVDVSTDPTDPDFYGDVRLGQYTNFTLSTKRGSAEEIHRDRSHIAQDRKDGEFLFATFQTRGNCVVEQAGHTAMVPPAHWSSTTALCLSCFALTAPTNRSSSKCPPIEPSPWPASTGPKTCSPPP